MFRTIILIIISALVYLTAFSQKSISGIVYDGHTLRPLSKAIVRMGHRNIRTDATGTFSVPFKEDKQLEVSAAGFYDYDRSLYDITDFNNVAVYLVPQPMAKGLKVSGEVVAVYEPNFEYLFDFEFIDNLLIVGSYLNRNISERNSGTAIKNCALSLFEMGELTHRMIIPDYPQRLRRSAFGEVYIEGLDYALQVQEESGQLSYEKMDFKEFKTNVVPWTVSFSNSAFKVRIVREIPQVEHYCYQGNGDRGNLIRSARNKAYFSKTISDYTMLDNNQRKLAISLSEEQGYPKYYYASYIRSGNREPDFRLHQPYGNGLDRDLRHPYTPVYKNGESVLILDAMNQWIYRHSHTGESLDSVYFQIDLPAEELQHIEQDRVTEELYSVHEKNGVHYIRKVDTERGALGKPMKVAYPFPEKIKIYNGSIFYIRHNSDEGFKHLYSEKLQFF